MANPATACEPEHSVSKLLGFVCHRIRDEAHKTICEQHFIGKHQSAFEDEGALIEEHSLRQLEAEPHAKDNSEGVRDDVTACACDSVRCVIVTAVRIALKFVFKLRVPGSEVDVEIFAEVIVSSNQTTVALTIVARALHILPVVEIEGSDQVQSGQYVVVDCQVGNIVGAAKFAGGGHFAVVAIYSAEAFVKL